VEFCGEFRECHTCLPGVEPVEDGSKV